jgi:hypothetical protein
MWNKKTQDILHTFFTKEVKDLTPVDYNLFIQSPESVSFTSLEKPNYPSLPQGTVIVASGEGDEGVELIVRTLDNTYHIFTEQGIEIELSETPEIDLSTPVGKLYGIKHYYQGSYYHFTSYTSHTGYIIHLIVDGVDPHLGGFSIFTKDFIQGSKYTNI